MPGGVPNQFVELAQEGAQPAFQSIESVVQAVSSVSLMLESTYTAVRASFQAVLGVAEQFSNMKLQISQVSVPVLVKNNPAVGPVIYI